MAVASAADIFVLMIIVVRYTPTKVMRIFRNGFAKPHMHGRVAAIRATAVSCGRCRRSKFGGQLLF